MCAGGLLHDRHTETSIIHSVHDWQQVDNMGLSAPHLDDCCLCTARSCNVCMPHTFDNSLCYLCMCIVPTGADAVPCTSPWLASGRVFWPYIITIFCMQPILHEHLQMSSFAFHTLVCLVVSPGRCMALFLVFLKEVQGLQSQTNPPKVGAHEFGSIVASILWLSVGNALPFF